ncbi:MAG: Lipopolysaccharide export system permease protein LptF, partial [uncultured Rubellimicrobium sp.]
GVLDQPGRGAVRPAHRRWAVRLGVPGAHGAGAPLHRQARPAARGLCRDALCHGAAHGGLGDHGGAGDRRLALAARAAGAGLRADRRGARVDPRPCSGPGEPQSPDGAPSRDRGDGYRPAPARWGVHLARRGAHALHPRGDAGGGAPGASDLRHARRAGKRLHHRGLRLSGAGGGGAATRDDRRHGAAALGGRL